VVPKQEGRNRETPLLKILKGEPNFNRLLKLL
jgi:hypothetical protein